MSRDDELMKMRYGTLDSNDAANRDVYDDSDWEVRILWFSALASISRVSHVKRHGIVFTTDEVRSFYSNSDNCKNCLCSLSSILVNVKTGEIVEKPLLERMLAAQKKHLESK
ncbi:MAG: hypothetical protein ACI846_001112 [Pseudoalteromonas distincta]|jgi:hypothetical protein|uniref:hypothetical protein n=1 Tax=Pseudoalteromonas distincta TaxID=77608 RepID=UPI0039E2FC5F